MPLVGRPRGRSRPQASDRAPPSSRSPRLGPDEIASARTRSPVPSSTLLARPEADCRAPRARPPALAGGGRGGSGVEPAALGHQDNGLARWRRTTASPQREAQLHDRVDLLDDRARGRRDTAGRPASSARRRKACRAGKRALSTTSTEAPRSGKSGAPRSPSSPARPRSRRRESSAFREATRRESIPRRRRRRLEEIAVGCR